MMTTGVQQLNRAVTRDLPLFLICASYGAHLRDLSSNIIGTPFSRNFVLLDRGTAIIHRDNNEWYSVMPAVWAKAIDDRTNLAAIRDTISDCEEAIERIKTIKLSVTIGCFNALCQIIVMGVPGMIFAHWIPIYAEQNLGGFKAADISYFQASRKKIESFFSLAANAAYKFIDLLAQMYGFDPALLKYATQD